MQDSARRRGALGVGTLQVLPVRQAAPDAIGGECTEGLMEKLLQRFRQGHL